MIYVVYVNQVNSVHLFRAFSEKEDADRYIDTKRHIMHDHCCACVGCDDYAEHKKWGFMDWKIKEFELNGKITQDFVYLVYDYGNLIELFLDHEESIDKKRTGGDAKIYKCKFSDGCSYGDDQVNEIDEYQNDDNWHYYQSDDDFDHSSDDESDT